VSGSAIRNSVIAWQATCRSGKEWDDHSFSPDAPLTGCTFDGDDYVTANVHGITERVHVIEDNGHFTTPTRAAGVFSLAVVLDENGRQIDTCETGTVHCTARASEARRRTSSGPRPERFASGLRQPSARDGCLS
jgi:hypothetical protein